MKLPSFSSSHFGLFVAIMAGAILMFAGCSSTPRMDWNTRVGSYSFDQAVVEMGPPDRSTQLSDGSTVAEWGRRTSGPRTSLGIGFGGGSYGGGIGTSAGVGVSTPIGSDRDNSLRLTFGSDGILKSWTDR